MPSTVTVLLSAYRGTSPAELDAALTSLWRQTRPAEHVLLVEDGPLTDELSAAVDTHRRAHPELRRLPLPVNRGLGPALQAGLAEITTDYVARLDTDDAAFPERLAVQVRYLDTHPSISVVGTALREFDGDAPGDITERLGAVRRLPTTPPQTAAYARINSPLNHPSIMARTDALTSVGGYRDVHHMEDYDLFARLIAHGHKLVNLPEPLTYFRVSDAQFARRTGREMFAAEKTMQRNLVSYGLISRPRAVFNLAARTTYRLLPTRLLRKVYARLFHSQGLR